MPVERGFYVTSGFGPREGGFHWGTDFGCGGGSGGRPVYAVKAGTVQYAGNASGFGKWVTIDHPSEVGGGYTVYGHVIPEVSPGQRVAEGQRIARINPDPSTNGGVAPHLHLEWHRFVWSPPGANRLDPMRMLAGARWQGDVPQTPTPHPSVIFGVDVSEHQNGLRLGGIRGIDFVIVRTTDGTHRDKAYRSHIDDAESAGLVTAAYHYLRAPSEGTTVAQQVSASLAVMGDRHRRPVWIDVETSGGTLTERDIRDCKTLYERAGVRVVGVYSYIPYWEGRIRGGEPKTAQFGAVWLANYPSSRVAPYRQLWDSIPKAKFDYPLGDQRPSLWQYGSTGLVDGWRTGVDVNVFRGTKDELRALFYGSANKKTPTPKEVTMTDFDRISRRYDSRVPGSRVTMTPLDMVRNIDAHAFITKEKVGELDKRLTSIENTLQTIAKNIEGR
ncbi:GH25 family lysozyme [Corynebacterium macclintockiae]|uniref:GH25 family lysozyme n=1 Tax=Corynebacterium macclintockiae TaxID=2913501 RepID=UPI003EBBF48C